VLLPPLGTPITSEVVEVIFADLPSRTLNSYTQHLPNSALCLCTQRRCTALVGWWVISCYIPWPTLFPAGQQKFPVPRL